MAIRNFAPKIPGFIKKYKFALLILLVGILLMGISSQGSSPQDESPESMVQTDKIQSLVTVEESLTELLSCIEGAGKVRLMLTQLEGECIVYQTDAHTTNSSDTQAAQIDTVVITDSDRNQCGLIQQVNPPVYLGAIVVCQGADKPAVRLAIVDAVSKATGLGADRISVLKMK